MTNLYSNIFLLVKIQFDQVEMFEVLEVRKNLDLRKILVTPKIFLKSRVYCSNILISNTNDSYFNHEGFFSIGENGQKQA